MTEQMQRDASLLDLHFRLYKWDAETLAAWQRIKASLSPDREVVARALYEWAIDGEAGPTWDEIPEDERATLYGGADAAIKAMQGETK